MLKERRNWITKYKDDHAGKVPEDLTDFKNRFEDKNISAEEEAARKAAEEEEKLAAKKKKE